MKTFSHTHTTPTPIPTPDPTPTPPKKVFGTSLNFKRWADLGDGFECEEAPSLADFGLITEKKIAEPDTAIVEPKIFQNTLPLEENAVIVVEIWFFHQRTLL